MTPLRRHPLHCVLLALAGAVLAACGPGAVEPTAAPGAEQSADAGSASAGNIPATSGESTAGPVDDSKAATAPRQTSQPVSTANTSTTTTTTVPTLTVQANGVIAGGIGPIIQVRIDGVVIGTAEVRATAAANYGFEAPTLRAGAKVDIVYTNDGSASGVDRNLFLAYLTDGVSTVLPTAPGTIYDVGPGSQATDGLDTMPGQKAMYWGGAMRFVWPTVATADSGLSRKNDASRLLQQATFGPTTAEITRLSGMTNAAWLAEQSALPFAADFVPALQRQYDLGDPYRPKGTKFTPAWLTQRFWPAAAASPDQLRRRTGFALHQIFMVSMAESGLYEHARAYANYLDTLNRGALGNFRTLLEEMALSPAMGLYLSHMRNRKEDPDTGRLPDENFAREVMQLFTIGLVELNIDGTPKLDATGRPIETYTNADVMAMAKVFTGWSWAFPDAQLTDANFRFGNPDYSQANDTRIDLLKMKAYPGQHSTAEKRLFAGKAWATTVPANSSAQQSLKIALDILFNHPNVGPFISRQLIQHMVTSNPSPAYVARVAAVFNRNSAGVRGDLGSVVRTLLLDPEARAVPSAGFGKVREPVLRVTHWMRAFNATSVTGDWAILFDLNALSQKVLHAPSVFGYFRPGYVPPNTRLADAGSAAPEFQLVNETSTAAWVNLCEVMAGDGIGWAAAGRDVKTAVTAQAALVTPSRVDPLVQNLNLLLFGGSMSKQLQLDIVEAVTGVVGTTAADNVSRARVALFVAMSSPEYLIQR